MPITTLLIFVVVVVAALYCVRYIPDATLQGVAKLIIVVGALIWLVVHMHELLHLSV
jgi:flagellar biosynthesis protein FliQ